MRYFILSIIVLLPFFSFASIAPIIGRASVCVGSTDTLSNTTTGGIWSSGVPGVATVGSLNGVVTGISAGIVTITYRVGSDSVTTTITVMATVVPGVSIIETHPFFSGLDTFIAIPVNGGSAPQYQWFINGYPLAGKTSDTLVYGSLLCSDSLYVHVTSDAYCAVPNIADTNAALCDISTTAVPDVLNKENELIYPNPATDNFTIKGAGGSEVRIYNLVGREMLNNKINSSIEVVNIQLLTAGTYIVHVTRINGDMQNLQLIKE